MKSEILTEEQTDSSSMCTKTSDIFAGFWEEQNGMLFLMQTSFRGCSFSYLVISQQS